jgi:Pentapeptide repeats (8 copies)
VTDYRHHRADVIAWPAHPEPRAALERYLDELSGGSYAVRPMFEADRYNLAGADLSGLDLDAAYLFNADLSGVRMLGCSLTKANLIAALLDRAELTDAYLHKVEADECSAVGATFVRANLLGAELRRATLTGADFRDAILNSCRLLGTDLRRADLRGAFLRDARFGTVEAPTRLDGARMAGATLDDAHGVVSGNVDVGDTEPYPIEGDTLTAWLQERGARDVRAIHDPNP